MIGVCENPFRRFTPKTAPKRVWNGSAPYSTLLYTWDKSCFALWYTIPPNPTKRHCNAQNLDFYELKDLHDESERAHICGVAVEDVRPEVKAIVLADPLEITAENARRVLERGQWPRFFFTKNGKGGIARKTYLENVGGRLPTNLWPFAETGHTDEAKKEMLAIFNGKATFDTPKPHRLIEFVLRVAGDDPPSFSTPSPVSAPLPMLF